MRKSLGRLVLVLPLALLLCLTFGCQRKTEEVAVKAAAPVVNLEAEKAAVKTAVDQYWQSMKSKDMEAFSRVMAHDPDMVNFGTDAAERFVGWEPLKEAIERQNKSVDFEVVSTRDEVIKVHSSGEVAWVSEIGDAKGKTQGQPFSLEGCRFTAVLEKRAGNWVIVQFQASMPVAGQAVKY
jgi:ketosteroid isomerase-like protein